MILEGPGYLIRRAPDGPWRGWVPVSLLDGAGLGAAPAFAALETLAALVGAFPGGLDLVWHRVPGWLRQLPPEQWLGFWIAATAIPGLVHHVPESLGAELPRGAFRAWVHAPQPPATLGRAWLEGDLGWIPSAGGSWILPGRGLLPVREGSRPGAWPEPLPGFHWGEVQVPFPALGALDLPGLVRSLEETQASLERAMSLRLQGGGWPQALPFQRRQGTWRISLLGGAQFLKSGGDWKLAWEGAEALRASLQESLRIPCLLGPGFDPGAGALLGRQAMREGLRWRASLSLPPEPATFSPGFGAAPWRPSPLSTRCSWPEPWSGKERESPLAFLLVPGPPSGRAAQALVETLSHPPAIRWLPPGHPIPWTADPEDPWEPHDRFPMPPSPDGGMARSLFED
ncbi:MAG: hypothetical protein HY823_09180 [Acidobacteria bacterium]|nr:hypothetical protein [Acidobacteriota bacterium]